VALVAVVAVTAVMAEAPVAAAVSVTEAETAETAEAAEAAETAVVAMAEWYKRSTVMIRSRPLRRSSARRIGRCGLPRLFYSSTRTDCRRR